MQFGSRPEQPDTARLNTVGQGKSLAKSLPGPSRRGSADRQYDCLWLARTPPQRVGRNLLAVSAVRQW